MEKTVIDKLTVDMQTLCTLPRWQVDGAIVGLGKTIAPKNGREKLFIRCPWSEIPEDYYKQCNFHFTITPDRHKFIEDPHSLEYKKKTISLLINMIINEESIERAVTVYEWGEKGASHGSLHFHLLLKTSERDVVFDKVNDLFNSRSKYKNITCLSKHVHDAEYRNRLYNIYFRKEQQNKVKCLYVKL